MIGLFSNGADLFNVHVTGGQHSWTFQTFDIANDAAALDGFNNTLNAMDWSSAPTVTLQMFAAPIGYPGWQLHATNATFTADAGTLPEPAWLALPRLGIGGLAFVHRRKVYSPRPSRNENAATGVDLFLSKISRPSVSAHPPTGSGAAGKVMHVGSQRIGRKHLLPNFQIRSVS